MPSASVRKQRSTKKTASKRAQLEDKLDDLVSLLRTQAVPQPDRLTSFQPATPSSLSYSPQQDAAELPHTDVLTDQELVIFGQRHLPFFPLIFLPPSLSAKELTHEQPLVALAIKTICNKGRSYQAELSKELRRAIALRTMVDGEKSLELLLSVLMCMTW